MTQAPEEFPPEPPPSRLGETTPSAPPESPRVPAQRLSADGTVTPAPVGPPPPVEMASPTAPPVYQVPPGYFWPRPEPKRSRLRTVVVVMALVASSVLAGALVNGWRPAMPSAETGVIEGAPVAPGEGTIPSPGPDASAPEVLAYLKEQSQLVLDAHAQSLVDGSRDGWLAAFDPTLHGRMTTRYETLRAMQVSRFDYRITSGPLEDSSGAVPLYEIGVAVTHCFAEPADECSPADVVFRTFWRAGDDGMVMVEVENSEGQDGPHPWETDELVAAVGARTVVAAPAHMSDRLQDALEISEEAALNADEWALWETPDRYVVYISGNEEFEVWFGGMFETDDVLGFALPLTGTVAGERQPSTYATVMNVDRTGWGYDLTSVIRHELGHAVTLWGAPSERYANDTWWMVEGIAEYIDHGDRPVDDYDRMWDVGNYVEDGGCSSDIVPPDEDDDTLAGSGKYGCGFLGVHYMIDTYGVDEFAAWFDATARQGESAAGTAEDVYGRSYADLMDEITDFIASTA
ncbi:hypothetical protein L0U85_12965 [Glycomyces sp. L485]|uniref:hypothetical protein n=1 Tax=Glycomyces sp. L485 TaxID=2909235 RepID=UPI001F4A9955|nr:hypothetical protein [Glycomyces sp. L485]MCH7231755.1 hypothetical protein [Glycomyces sp. L485]